MRRHLFPLVLLVAAAAACAVYAAGTVSERASLKGIDALRPTVAKLSVEAVAAKVDAKRLRAVIDDRLKGQGLPVKAGGVNDVSLTVSVSAQRDGVYAVHLRLELQQMVALFHEFVRDPESRTLAPTWSASWIGVLKPDEMGRLDEETGKLVDQFIADWRIGNLGRYK